MGDSGQATRKKKLAKKAGFPRHVKDMSKEQLEAAIKKKRECNTKALTIVEHMLEPCISEDWFLEQLRFIDAGHFQDIVEERALSKLCGYPLCAGNLKSFPSQQFRISTKYNKVYDITERKNFCSNQCYKAGKYVKDQLLTSPLWLRDKEDIPVFKLLPRGSQGTGVGEEVHFCQKNISESEVTKLKDDDKFVSVADYTQNTISQLSKKINNIDITKNDVTANAKDADVLSQKLGNDPSNTKHKPPSYISKEMVNRKESFKNANINETSEKEQELESCRSVKVCKDLKCEMLMDEDVGNSEVENPQTKRDSTACGGKGKDLKINECKNSNYKKSNECSEVTSSVIHIEKCLYEWFTIDSMCYLFGDEKVKDLVSDKGECIKEYYRAVGKSSWDPDIQERYEALCQRLNIMEIQENQYDKKELQLKPLPDYSVLKEKGEKMDLKIKAFYQGKLDYEMPTCNSKEESEIFTPSCVLPLVDIHAQNALRRRMVLDNLKRVLPDLLQTFGLSSRDISSEVRHLVSTFSLSAHNITFSRPEWNLLGLITIKMLSVRDMKLKMLLDAPQGVKYQTMLLMAFQQDGGYLERLMVWLTDMDNIMKKIGGNIEKT